MTSLISRFPSACMSYIPYPKLLSYIPIVLILICIGCARGSSQGQPTVSIADLWAQLQPLKQIGTYAGFDLNTGILYMGNDSIERWMRLDQGGHKVQTIRYARRPSGQNYVDLPSEEFRFRIGEIVFSGNSDLLTYSDYQIVQRMGGGKRVTVQFTYTADAEAQPIFHLWVHYEIYPDLPVIRKWITVQNLTDSAFFLEDITIESLSLFAGRGDNLQIWRYGISGVVGEPLPTPWGGGASEAFILVGDTGISDGVVLGNESAGLLKYYTVHLDRETVSIGLMPTTAINGPEIRVPPGQSVDSPKIWTMFIQDALQTALETITQNPLAYIPSYSKEAKLQIPEIEWIRLETAWKGSMEAMQPGDLIALDYDWKVEDLQRIKQISQQVHEGGGKFGIRLPIAEIHTAVLDRPEWRLASVPVHRWRTSLKSNDVEVEGEQREEETQQPATHEPVRVVYCVLSDYGYYLTQAVKTLIEETAADTLIFDRPILGSQDSLLKGCNALGHQHYTRAESIGVIYRWLFEFADHLHREYPALQLGITVSAYGVEQPDAACLSHFDFFLQ